MDAEIVQRHFARIGAQAEVNFSPSRYSFHRLDVREEKGDEVFFLEAGGETEIVVLDVQPEQRHLLLMARGPAVGSETGKRKYLCGHDERHWFVAAVPDRPGVKDVRDALDALKPEEVLDSQETRGVKAKDWHKRRNLGYLRQGEWFFVPCPEFEPEDELRILDNEPIQRSGSTAHIVEKLYQVSAPTSVYVCPEYPHGVSEEEYERLISENWAAGRWPWRVMQRAGEVYALGKVRHPDHKTIDLPFWHRVMMAEEPSDSAVVFLD
jgi:hypothetical protein